MEYINLLYTQVLFLLILALLLTYQMLKRGIKPLKWMIIVIFLALVRVVWEIIIIHMTHQRIFWDAVNSGHFIAYSASLLALYSYGEMAISEKPKMSRAIFVILSLGIYLGFQLSGFIHPLTENANPENWIFPKAPVPYWEFPFDVYSIMVWSFMLYVYFKMAVFSKTTEIRILSIGLFISMGLFLVVSLIEFSEHFTGHDISAAITTIPAFIILLAVYIYNPRFAYSSPVELYRIILLHESGPTLVEEILSDKYAGEKNTNILVSGMATTLNSVFQEMTMSSGNLEIMKSSSSTMIFSKQKNIIAILEVQESTYLLKSALQGFTLEFSRKFDTELENFKGNVSVFSDYKYIMHKYFPFMA
ncbi:MAG: hypothetical protein INQ03_02215 [Candidatus Heimdallarchaeota archaeon]|nr:hypothetical protein [Candidatus Heimdallarchaeota archaeon]